MKQAYVSISDLAWKNTPLREFEQLKTGYVGVANGYEYQITQGIPCYAKLREVIYLYEDESLPDVDDPFKQPPTIVMSKARRIGFYE